MGEILKGYQPTPQGRNELRQDVRKGIRQLAERLEGNGSLVTTKSIAAACNITDAFLGRGYMLQEGHLIPILQAGSDGARNKVLANGIPHRYIE